MAAVQSEDHHEVVNESRFLSLPGEIRNRIYEFTTINDLELFADKTYKPGLLKASPQLREEYTDIFFSNPILQIDAYHGPVDSWKQVRSKEFKRAVFERSRLMSLTGFWSLVSARRYCQREYSDYQGNVQTGILTVRARSGLHRWQWTYFSGDSSLLG